MKIGIIGSGDVGKALTKGFLSRGDDVVIGTRSPEKMKAFVSGLDARVQVTTPASAAAFGEIIVLATNYDGAKNAIELCGKANLENKTIIDTTNPLKLTENQPVELLIGMTDSAGESIQRWLPNSNVVKAFNSVGNGLMYKPKFKAGPPTMFICGNSDSAKHDVVKILEDFGWDVADVGDITESRWLEPLCILWVHYGMKSGSWTHAYKLLRG